METLAIESFVDFCDDMTITNESAYRSPTILVALKNLIAKIKHIIKRMMITLLKFKTIKISKEKNKAISLVEYNLNKLSIDAFDLLSGKDCYDELQYKFNQIQDSKEYAKAFEKEDTLSESNLASINSSEIVSSLKKYDKCLEEAELIVNNQRKDKDTIPMNATYWNCIFSIYNERIKVLMQYFKAGKVTDKDGNLINLGESFTVEPDSPTNY